jgi:hypothetical protein
MPTALAGQGLGLGLVAFLLGANRPHIHDLQGRIRAVVHAGVAELAIRDANHALLDGGHVAAGVAHTAVVALAGIEQDAQAGKAVQEPHELAPRAKVTTPGAQHEGSGHQDHQRGQRRGRIVARREREMHRRSHHHV